MANILEPSDRFSKYCSRRLCTYLLRWVSTPTQQGLDFFREMRLCICSPCMYYVIISSNTCDFFRKSVSGLYMMVQDVIVVFLELLHNLRWTLVHDCLRQEK